MRVRSVESCCHHVVPDQILREPVLPLRRNHVRLVLVGSESGAIGGYERGVVVLTRIAGRAERMRPAEMQAVQGVNSWLTTSQVPHR
jgi:hypothetical protein